LTQNPRFQTLWTAKSPLAAATLLVPNLFLWDVVPLPGGVRSGVGPPHHPSSWPGVYGVGGFEGDYVVCGLNLYDGVLVELVICDLLMKPLRVCFNNFCFLMEVVVGFVYVSSKASNLTFPNSKFMERCTCTKRLKKQLHLYRMDANYWCTDPLGSKGLIIPDVVCRRGCWYMNLVRVGGRFRHHP